ncbi:FtsK/SpoIIIE domain-containing protein [Streptomyces sp. M10(2022)]
MLRMPIGFDGKGRPLLLDLKESAQGGMGPHGLIVGATGSGKSELLRTLVTGLTMTHSPICSASCWWTSRAAPPSRASPSCRTSPG